MRQLAAILFLLTTTASAESPPPGPPPPPLPAAQDGLQIKWMRDSAEYAAITRGTYADATEDVLAAAKKLKKGTWGVVLDVDETVLDNSTYQLERAAYGVGFDEASWNAWCARRAAAPIPGAREFLTAVREAGGHVAFVTNRFEVTREDTRANLESTGLWSKDDALCLLADAKTPGSKAERRQSVQQGTGACGWSGTPVTVLAFVGDQMGDFPTKEEAGADAPWGHGYWMIPNAMYGGWTKTVTR